MMDMSLRTATSRPRCEYYRNRTDSVTLLKRHYCTKPHDCTVDGAGTVADEPDFDGLRLLSLHEYDLLEQQAQGLHDPSLERDNSSFWETRERLIAEVLRDYTGAEHSGTPDHPVPQDLGQAPTAAAAQMPWQQALVPDEMDEWVINPYAPGWPDFFRWHKWTRPEKWPFPVGTECAEGAWRPFSFLNPVRLIACLKFDADAARKWKGQLPSSHRLVVPGIRWYQQQAAGEARDPSLPGHIPGWLPLVRDMHVAATTDFSPEEIVQMREQKVGWWSLEEVGRLDPQQRQLLLLQLRLVKAITQGEALLRPLPPLPPPVKPLSLKKKLRKLFFG